MYVCMYVCTGLSERVLVITLDFEENYLRYKDFTSDFTLQYSRITSNILTNLYFFTPVASPIMTQTGDKGKKKKYSHRQIHAKNTEKRKNTRASYKKPSVTHNT